MSHDEVVCEGDITMREKLRLARCVKCREDGNGNLPVYWLLISVNDVKIAREGAKMSQEMISSSQKWTAGFSIYPPSSSFGSHSRETASCLGMLMKCWKVADPQTLLGKGMSFNSEKECKDGGGVFSVMVLIM